MSNTPRREQGTREYEALMGTAPADTLAQLRDRAPLIYDALVEGAFGGPLARPELGRAARESATVAILAAWAGRSASSPRTPAPRSSYGLRPTNCSRCASTSPLYAGFPRALNALAVMDEVLAARRPPAPGRVCAASRSTTTRRWSPRRGESGPPVLLSTRSASTGGCGSRS